MFQGKDFLFLSCLTCIVTEECLYFGRSPDCTSSFEDFEALNTKYGIEKQAVFVRINFELEPVSKT